jgi:hypothetical protein
VPGAVRDEQLDFVVQLLEVVRDWLRKQKPDPYLDRQR